MLFNREKRKNEKDPIDHDDPPDRNKKKRKVEEKESWWPFSRSAPSTPVNNNSNDINNETPKKTTPTSSSEHLINLFQKSQKVKKRVTRRLLSDFKKGSPPPPNYTPSPPPKFEFHENLRGSIEMDDIVNEFVISSPNLIAINNNNNINLPSLSSIPSMDRIKTLEDFNNFYNHRDIILQPESKRDYVALEILTTEETYVKSLQVCDLIYNYPLEKWTRCLSMMEANILSNFFVAFRDIINVNAYLLDSMRDRFCLWDKSQCIGDVIGSLAPFLKTYKNYAELYEPALYAIDHFKKKEPNGPFIEILRNGEIHPLSQGYKIDSLLILPIQRVPRYTLLLKELIAETPLDHLDHIELQRAILRIEEIAQEINRAIKEAESRDYCIQIQQKIDTKFGTVALPIPCLVEAHRKFIKEGIVTKVSSLIDIIHKRLFLFNDILLLCSATALGAFRSGKFSVEHTFFLEQTSVFCPPTQDTFEISDETAHFEFMVENAELKKEWLQVLSQTIAQQKAQFEENRLRGISFSREMMAKEQAYSEATKCTLCQKDFIFFYSPRRKHFCRGCGNAVCGDCSLHRAGDETRLCDTCWTNNLVNN